MTFEDLLLVQSEAILGPKNQDLVVHRLACEPLTWSLKQAKETYKTDLKKIRSTPGRKWLLSKMSSSL